MRNQNNRRRAGANLAGVAERRDPFGAVGALLEVERAEVVALVHGHGALFVSECGEIRTVERQIASTATCSQSQPLVMALDTLFFGAKVFFCPLMIFPNPPVMYPAFWSAGKSEASCWKM